MLHGRAEELERLDSLLDGARRGSGRSLLLTGEAGIGKTALLGAARERAGDMLVIRGTGIEGELNLPFAALGELTAPIVEWVGRLPEPQAEALRAALALSAGRDSPRDRFAAAAGFLGLLRAASEGQPLLLTVDDAQWLDRPSAECLGYAARRLEGSSIAMLAARRSGADGTPLAGLGGELTVSGLADEHALSLLRTGSGSLGARLTESVLKAASGNPLALRALPELLDPEKGDRDARIEDLLEPSHGLHHAFEGRIARLDEGAQLALLVAAASGSGEAGPIVGACAELGVEQSAIERGEALGLIAVTENRIEFDHPLLRGLAYQRAGPAQRRRAHAALARSDTGDRRAWHLAAAAIGTDEDAADELEQAAARARSRGAKPTEAQALGRAAELSADPAERTRRLIEAGLAGHAAGDRDRSLGYLRAATDTTDPKLLTRAQQMLAVVSLWGGNADDGYALFVEAAEGVAADDPVRAATLLADAAVAATAQGDYRKALAKAEEAHERLGEGGEPQDRAVVLSALGWCLAVRGEAARAGSLFEQVEPLIAHVDPFSPAAQSIGLALNSRLFSEDYERARAECRAIVEALRQADAIALLPFPMAVGSDAAHRLGDWDGAEHESAEALALSVEAGEPGPETMALVVRAWLAAGRGHERELEEVVARTFELSGQGGLRSVELFVRAAQGFGSLGLGRVDEAIEVLEEVAARADSMGLEEPTLIPWIPDIVEAYAHAGREPVAEGFASMIERQAERTGGSVGAALAARCRGLVDDGFDAHFERALTLHSDVSTPFERARTQLAYGLRLHRAGRRVDARAHLYEAVDVFRELQAKPWVKRAEAELEAAGARPRAPAFDPDELTAQETRVAHEVAAGATNREVAAKLFLSPKTIEFHLGRVYRKLDIHSRTELATLVASGALGDAGRKPS